jgi:4-hydroxyacetophenone monooxygenase
MAELLPIPNDDDALYRALRDAHIPSLMAALVHVTGDAQIVRGEIRPKNDFMADAQGGLTPAQQDQVRALAFRELKKFRDSGQRLPAPPSESVIGEMVNFMIGQPVSPGYAQFLISELAIHDEDPYGAPALAAQPAGKRAAFRVVIIGAGMSGLLAGIRLKQAGIPFTIVERAADVGGTWWHNTYPGCRVDSPNHIYSYSFEPTDWPQHFSPQRVLQRYFAHCADKYGLRPYIRFETEVTEAAWDDASSTWRVAVRTKDGRTETLEANAVISAVGQLSRPKWPDIPGRDRFKGISFHSALWEHQHDLTGKRVLVIGTGASAFQFIPEIAKRAGHITVLQRTPPWILPTPEYHDDVPAGKHWLLNHVPFYAKWYRFSMFWRAAEGILASVEKDDAWPHPDRAVSAANDEMRVLLTQSMTDIVGADSPLLEKIIPKYPVAGKRILLDNGNYLRALMRPNVELVTDPIREITETGVVTQSGQRYDTDVLIYGTGFQASRFLWPMKITGREGVDLQQHWAGDPRAYLGITIPGFPNFFCCYGPNTNIVVNGSIIFFSECEIRYVLGCLELLLARGAKALDPRRAVHEAYNRRIDAGNLRMAWGAANVPTWYKNDKGRVTQNWPFTLLEYWAQTRAPNPSDYELLS